MINFEVMNDDKMYEECVNKILDMDEYDLVSLIKNITFKHPQTMKVILKY